MKRNIFIKDTYESRISPCIVIYIIAVLMIVSIIYEFSVIVLAFTSIAFSVLAMNCINSANAGMYIEGKDIYYKYKNSKIKIALDEIKGIKILRSQNKTGIFRHYLYGRYNKYLYSCVFVRNINSEITSYKEGDMRFVKEFSDDSVCVTVYDEELIKYIKALKPEVVIMSEVN